jgi:hypothetical protein
VSDLLTADTHAGRSVYVDRGLDEEYPDGEPPPVAETAWTEVEAQWFEHLDERTVSAEPVRVEIWRVDLVREEDEWRVCEFSRQPD